MSKTLFDEEQSESQPTQARCTPERLLDFVQRTRAVNGRLPTLLECKEEFGGILAVMTSAWELERQGKLNFKNKR